MKYQRIFVPGKIGSLRVKNRLVMPPMVRNYATREGAMTRRYLDHLEAIARGGVGTMILEASYVSSEGKGFVNELGIFSDRLIPGLRRAVKICHRHGAKIGIQIFHAGRQTYRAVTGKQQVAPSPLAEPVFIKEKPRALTIPEIRQLVKKYAQACRRAQKAGFDFVEIHGAHGYLINQFLSKFSNKRKDGYGGSLENRLRFLLEIIAQARQLVGPKFPITVRLSGAEYVPGGITIRETQEIAKILEKAGVAALHISACNYTSYVQGLMIPPMAQREAPLLHLAAAVKKVVKIPVIAVGKIHDPALIEKALQAGQADFVAIGRVLLADPEWPNKVKSGREKDINHCVHCNQGCITRLFAQKDAWCTVNPWCGRERLFEKKLRRRKKILVVGGGPAGMTAALVAASRGHEVLLYERQRRLGHSLDIVGDPPHREDWYSLQGKLVRDLKHSKVTVQRKTEFVPEIAAKERPDAVIVAIGASPKIPEIPGIQGREWGHVFSAKALLADEAWPRGKKVVVVGGGCAGAQTAEFLATQMARFQVTILEAGLAIAEDAPVDERFLLLGRLAKLRVKILTNTRLLSVGTKTVTIKTKKGSRTLPADTVVLAIGSIPNDGMQFELKKIVKKVYIVGDAKEPRRITEAILEGAKAGLRV